MADTYPYRETIQYIADRCAELFAVETVEIGEPLDDPEALLADYVEAPQQPDPQLMALARACDGFTLSWEVADEQRPAGLTSDYTSGSIALLDLSSIYYNWDDELLVEQFLENDKAHYQEIGQHLQRFHVVDYYADFADTMVGIYLDEPRNPELYAYTGGEGSLPEPLGVDVQGYLELLKLSLGYLHWPFLLVELNEYFTALQAEPFRPEGGDAQNFVSDMTRLNPDFTLEKFVARYAEVRLRRQA